MHSKSTSSTGTGRRGFLKQASTILAGAPSLAVLSSRGFAAPAKDSERSYVTADTTGGQLRGESVEGIKAFKGIPYGGNTAGKNRFRPPTAAPKWSGVRDALEWGHVAPQPISAGRYDYVRMIRWLELPGGQAEDCLVLNVWTPALKDGVKRPVLVSFHGGGFVTGTSNNPGYNGHSLAKFGDVVVVTVNHRLGCLGYLHLASLAPEFTQAGNAGMLDLVASLHWVRDNIENFGGDPGSVMIFGQSGGAGKTTALLSMPAAKGLFHRAGLQSGVRLRFTTPDAANKTTEAMLAQIGFDKSRVRELQEVPFEMMIAAEDAITVRNAALGFNPVVDGSIVPAHPFDPVATEVSADVPVIISSALDDAALGRTDFALDDAGLKEQVKAFAPDDTDHVIGMYRKRYPKSTPFLLLCKMLTDRGTRKNGITAAERKAAQKRAPVYMYQWEFPSQPYNGKFGAVHGTDVPMVFHNVDGHPITGNGPDSRAMADKLAGAWVAFAKTGNPSHPGIPQWPAYTPDTRATMIFDRNCRVENDPTKEFRTYWEKKNT